MASVKYTKGRGFAGKREAKDH